MWLQGGPFIVFGEGYWRSQRAEDQASYRSQYGAWGQIIADVYKHHFGLGARVNWVEPNLGMGTDRFLSAEGQFAWFIHAPELILKARYAWIDQKSPGTEPAGALPDVPGTSHVATLQLNLSF